jgi:hypothetical protein
VLLLSHALTALLNDRAHQATTLLGAQRQTGTPSRSPHRGGWAHARSVDRLHERQPLTQSSTLPGVARRSYSPAGIGTAADRRVPRTPRRFRSPAAGVRQKRLRPYRRKLRADTDSPPAPEL